MTTPFLVSYEIGCLFVVSSNQSQLLDIYTYVSWNSYTIQQVSKNYANDWPILFWLLLASMWCATIWANAQFMLLNGTTGRLSKTRPTERMRLYVDNGSGEKKWNITCFDHSCFLTCSRHMLQRTVDVDESCSSSSVTFFSQSFWMNRGSSTVTVLL